LHCNCFAAASGKPDIHHPVAQPFVGSTCEAPSFAEAVLEARYGYGPGMYMPCGFRKNNFPGDAFGTNAKWHPDHALRKELDQAG